MQIQFRQFHPDDTEQTVALWQACGLTRPWNDPHKDIERKLQQEPELFIVAERDGLLLGSVMAGYDGHRGWLYAVAVDPGLRGRGIGRALVEHACAALAARGCGKVNLQIRDGNEAVAAFYETLSFEREARISLGRVL